MEEFRRDNQSGHAQAVLVRFRSHRERRIFGRIPQSGVPLDLKIRHTLPMAQNSRSCKHCNAGTGGPGVGKQARCLKVVSSAKQWHVLYSFLFTKYGRQFNRIQKNTKNTMTLLLQELERKQNTYLGASAYLTENLTGDIASRRGTYAQRGVFCREGGGNFCKE